MAVSGGIRGEDKSGRKEEYVRNSSFEMYERYMGEKTKLKREIKKAKRESDLR